MDYLILIIILLLLSIGLNLFLYFFLYNNKRKQLKNNEEQLQELSDDILEDTKKQVEDLSEKYNNIIVQLEMSNNNYEVFFNYMKERLQTARIRMKEVDRGGAFEADDEVGFIFRTIYDVSADLSNFLESVDLKPIDEDYLNRKSKT